MKAEEVFQLQKKYFNEYEKVLNDHEGDWDIEEVFQIEIKIITLGEVLRNVYFRQRKLLEIQDRLYKKYHYDEEEAEENETPIYKAYDNVDEMIKDILAEEGNNKNDK